MNTSNKIIFLIMITCFFNYAEACDIRDYDCIKRERNSNYYKSTDRDYIKNKKIYITGYDDDGARLDIDSRDSRYILKNVRVIAKNTATYNKYGDSSIVTVKNYGSKPSNIRMSNVDIATIGTNKVIGSTNYLSDTVCVAAYCQYGNVETDNFKNKNYGSLYLNLD